MKEQFEKKLNNREYISTNLFNFVKKDFQDLIPENFDLEKYNEEVIILGLNKLFPHDNINMNWIELLFKSSPDEEKIPHAEERRLFYVGLTRTKNDVYLLVNENPNLRSQYINDIYSIIRDVNDEKKDS